MLSFFLARRFFSNEKDGRSEGVRKASRPAIRIATGGISIGLAVMIISLCFVNGFQNEIRKKLTGFSAHLELLDFRSFSSPESYPLVTDTTIINIVKDVTHAEHVQRVSEKMGVFKTQDDFAGIVLKGIAQDYDVNFIKDHIVEGEIPDFRNDVSSNSVVISRTLANTLNLKLGDRIYSYFFSETIKQRRFKIVAIYDTHLPQFDKSVVWTDLFTVNRLNGWQADQSSCLEIRLPEYGQIPFAQSDLSTQFSGLTDVHGNSYSVLSIKDNPRTSSILSWLDLLDFNVLIILIIMIGVAGFTMISGLLILILERTNTIGILKALGCTNSRIRHSFLWYAAFIVLRGMLIGNFVGLMIVGLQSHFKWFHLNPETYYIDYVPVELNVWSIILVNISSLVATMLALVIPSLIVSRIEPAKSIQFD